MTRRTFLTGGVVGLVALTAGSVVWHTKGCSPGRRPSPAIASRTTDYVDHEGWMLTVADKQKLAPPASTPKR
jgi:hypothetical protein